MNKKNSSVNSLLFLKKFALKYKWQFVTVFLALLFTSSSILMLGYGLRLLIDHGFVNNNLAELYHAIYLLGALVIVLSISSYIRASTINIICEKIQYDITRSVFARLIYLPIEFFETSKVSDIITRLTVDTNMLNTVISNVASFLIRNTVMLLGSIVMLCILNLKLAGITFLVVPIMVLPIIIFGKYIRELTRKSQDMISSSSSQIDETFYGIRTVQSFNNEQLEIERFNQISEETIEVGKKRYRARALLASFAIFAVLFCVGIVLIIGSKDVLAGRITAGALASFLFYAIMAGTSFGGVTEVVGSLQKAGASAERIEELFNSKSSLYLAENPKTIDVTKVSISFEKVSFAYPALREKKVLSDISFAIENNEKITIAGHSGSGKSTIFNLLLRFYEIETGAIKINDIDIKELDLHFLRNIFAIVPQDPIIFSGSIFENIAYGKPSSTREEVEIAAKQAEIFDFINSLPQKFETFVGEKGVRLSGGQKQRIAIARAFLKNPKILLLDEATSALDAENEYLIQKAIERLGENRSVIMISHRPSTIKNSKKILLLEEGQIVGFGSNKELSKLEAYKKLI